ncbi:MAG: beta-galactosidase, partial [Armatimonadota bacterium]
GDYWPYAGTTGVAQLPYGLAMQRAVELSADANADLLFCPGVSGAAIPTVARQAIVKQVQAGKGLLLAGPPSCQSGWPQELFQVRDEAQSKAIVAGLDWDKIPGLGPTEPGHTANQPAVDYYHYGQGRVVVLRVNPTTYGCLVPRNVSMEGQDGVLDRSLGLAARAAAAAAGRPWQCPLTVEVAGEELSLTIGARPAGQLKQVVRIQDDLDRTLLLRTDAVAAQTHLPRLPAGRAYFLDVAVLDASGNTLGYASKYLPAAAGPTIEKITLSPTSQKPEALTPRVMLPEDGKVQMTAEIRGLTQAGQLSGQVLDSFDRVLARQSIAVPAGGGKVSLTFTLGRPVTVAHLLDLTLSANGQPLATQRQRFALALPYPYDDFTALLWSYGGGDPVLLRTDRMCYESGADMMDLCHMGGYDDVAAARQYNLSARTGLRVLPYVTWMGGKANADGLREPCLHDPKYLAETSAALTKTCRQAAVYSPAGYTLGDENRLNYNANDCCFGPHTLVAFREWLQTRYGTIARLNDTWASSYTSFAEVRPPQLAEAAKLQRSFAPWIDHKSF